MFITFVVLSVFNVAKLPVVYKIFEGWLEVGLGVGSKLTIDNTAISRQLIMMPYFPLNRNDRNCYTDMPDVNIKI